MLTKQINVLVLMEKKKEQEKHLLDAGHNTD